MSNVARDWDKNKEPGVKKKKFDFSPIVWSISAPPSAVWAYLLLFLSLLPRDLMYLQQQQQQQQRQEEKKFDENQMNVKISLFLLCDTTKAFRSVLVCHVFCWGRSVIVWQCPVTSIMHVLPCVWIITCLHRCTRALLFLNIIYSNHVPWVMPLVYNSTRIYWLIDWLIDWRRTTQSNRTGSPQGVSQVQISHKLNEIQNIT